MPSLVLLLFFTLARASLAQVQYSYIIENEGVTITDYTGTDSVITIPSMRDGLPVKAIGGSAFRFRTFVTSVTIPNSVTTIGEYAFVSCSGLTSLTLPDSITVIGNGAFQGCTGLTSVTIPNSATLIGGSAFSGCTGLTSVTIPNGVTLIGAQAFRGCTGLTSVMIANGVTAIAYGAFFGCTGLTSVTIPSSVTSIGQYAFYGCTKLIDITVDSNNAVYASLDGVLFSKSMTAIMGYPAGRSVAYTIPNTVTSIGEWAFDGCAGLIRITIPNSVANISEYAFHDCTGLTSITIPNSVTTIGEYAFWGCTGLTSMTIPSSVTSIGNGAIRGCTGLTRVTMPNSVTSIGRWVFYGCTGLTSMTIPGSITWIDQYAFYGCTSLTSLTIPDGVTSIGVGAFRDCTGLTNVTIPNSVVSIGKEAFRGCTELSRVYFSGNAPADGGGTFQETSVTVYYLQGTTGWGATFGGRPTALWNLPPALAGVTEVQVVAGPSAVAVDYRIELTNTISASVELSVSTNGGASFSLIPVGAAASGDLGSQVSAGNRTILWIPAATLPPDSLFPNCKVKVSARTADASASAISSTFMIETPGPGNLVTVTGRVLDPQTDLPLGGVTVNVGGQTAITRGSGDYVLSGVALVSGNTLTITKPGQPTHTATLNAPPGTRQVVVPDVRLPPATAAGTPVVTGIEPRLDGLFLAGVRLVNDYTASVNWNGSAPGSVRFSANATPVATKTGSGPEYTANIDIRASFPPALRVGANRLRVVATSAAGVSSPPAEFGVYVLPLPFGLERATELYPFTLYSDKYLSLGFTLPPRPIRAVFDLPFVGKFGAEVAADFSVNYQLASGEWEAEIYSGDTLPKMKLHLGDKEAGFQLFLKADGRASRSTGWEWGDLSGGVSLDTEFELTRYGVADLITPGFSAALRKVPGLEQTLRNTSVIIWAKPQIEGSAVLTPRPEWDFKRFEVSGKIGLEAAYEPQFTKNLSLKIYVGGEPSMTFQYPGDFLKEARFRIYAGAEAKVYFFTFGPEELVLGEWSYPGNQALARLARHAVTSIGSPDDAMRLVSRDYLADGGERFVVEREAWAKQADGATTALENFRTLGRTPQGRVQRQGLDGVSEALAQADLPLLENVYPGSAPALAGRGSDLMMLYVADNGGANGLQFTDIRWTRFDGTNWTQPAAILADTRAEFAPQVVFDGNGDALAVWERVADPDFNTLDLDALAAELEIVTACWDHVANVWSEPEPLTANHHLDHEPLLCGPMTNGDVLLVWTQNTANQLMGTNVIGTMGNSDVLWRQWSAASRTWSTPLPLVTNLAYRLSQSLAGSSKRAVYAWTRDLNGSLINATDQQVFFRGWSNGVWGGVTQFTANTAGNQDVRAAVSQGGDAYLLWRAATNLVFNRNFAATNQVARSDSQTAGFTDYALTLGPAGNLALVWQEMSENGPDAHYRIYDPASDSWSGDALLFTDAGLERSFAPVWDDVGNLALAYDKVDILKTNKTLTLAGGGSVTISNVPQPGRVDLGVLKRRLVKDVALPSGSLRVQAENYMPGAALNVMAEVHNTGDVAVKDVAVAFYAGDPADGGELIENVTLPGWLEAGRTAAATIVWVLSDAGAARPLFAVADPARLITELSEANNTQSLTVGGTDLAVTLLSATVEANGAARVVAQVQNVGAPSAVASTVALRRIGETNAPMAAAAVIALDPGRLVQVALDVPPGILPEGLTALWLRTDDAAVTGDVNRANNVVSFAVNRFVDSDGDGMADSWETTHDLNPSDASDAGTDSDGDGMTNRDEYLAGVDPSDANSYLRIEFGEPGTGGGNRVVWGSAANHLYTIHRTSDVSIGFEDLSQHLLATPPENSFWDASATNNVNYFYRVEVE